MASSKIKSERICIEKMFVWEFDSVCFDDLKAGITGPTMTAVDPYNGTKYTGIFKFQKASWSDVSFSIDISPDPGIINYYYRRDDLFYRKGDIINHGFKKLEVYVDVIYYRHQESQLETTLGPNETFNTYEKLKQLWKDDSSVKFLIKCKGATIEAIKPIMAACSPVFKVMFEREWKESTNNVVEITDFDPEIVQKMVQFCENGTLSNADNLEEVYKIADKYDIPELLKLALAKFTDTTTIENVRSPLQMAKQFEMEELKKWWIRFCDQNDIYDFLFV